MQTLTLNGVKRAARKAYDERRLTAQAPKKKDRICAYAGNAGRGCAVGVALNKASHKKIAAYDEANRATVNMSGVGSLIEKGIVTIPGPRSGVEYKTIADIQSLHDDWANEAMSGAKTPQTLAAREAFLTAIAA